MTELYLDSKVFNYTYDQVEQIIQEEVVDENGEHLEFVGNYHILFG